MANVRSLRDASRRPDPASVESVRPSVEWQPSLLDASGEPPAIDGSFARGTRHALDATAWVDHCRGWVSSPSALFATLVESAPWSHRTVPMYGRIVAEPRLTAWYGSLPSAGDSPELFGAMADALTRRYGRTFDTVGAALYRDGRDSVAWHGDRIDPQIVEPIVAIVSLGSARALRMRPRGGGRARSFTLLPGDLFVMGGMSQRTWEHSVPKVAAAGPRLSLQFRHSQ